MCMGEVVDGDGDGDEDDVKSFQDPSSSVVDLLGVSSSGSLPAARFSWFSRGSEWRLFFTSSPGESI